MARIKIIDTASGMAIILVVVGHFSDVLPFWYGDFKTLLYKFHMPFFMFLSGFLLGLKVNALSTWQLYFKFIKEKAVRFGVPYVTLFCFFSLAKGELNIGSYYEFISLMKSAIFWPTQGPAIFLWYVYVLFQYYITFPILMRNETIQRNPIILVALGIFLTAIGIDSSLFEFTSYSKYFLFVALGINACLNFKLVTAIIQKMGMFFLVMFVVICLLELKNIFILNKTILGLVSIPALLFAASKIKSSFLASLGPNTYVIYIWNSSLIYLVVYCIQLVDKNYYENFVFYLPILLCSGLLGPLLCKKISRIISFPLSNYIFP